MAGDAGQPNRRRRRSIVATQASEASQAFSDAEHSDSGDEPMGEPDIALAVPEASARGTAAMYNNNT